MNESIFDKFNSMFDVAGLKADIETAASSNGDFVEVPHGDYEVRVSKLELGVSGEKSKNPGMPLAKIWYDIIAGDFKGQKIFQNQSLTSGFGIHKMNQLLESFESGIPIQFDDFDQYHTLLENVFKEIDGRGEYALHYGENNKGYSTYEITQRFQ